MNEVINFTTGNFDLNIKGELNEETKNKVLKSGIVYIVQRDGATKTYLELCGEVNDKGKKTLPKDFERDQLEYSPENLAKMCEAMTAALKPYGDFEVTGSEHVKGESQSEMKRATQFVDALLGGEGEASFRQLVGFLGGDSKADRDGLIKFAHDKGLGKSK